MTIEHERRAREHQGGSLAAGGASHAGDALTAALRELPEAEPPAGGWRQLGGPRDAGRRATGRNVGLALAASVAIAAVVTVVLLRAPDPSTAGSADVEALVQRSQALERRLAALRSRADRRVYSGHAAAALDELERRVGLIDLQLAGAPVSGAQRWELWQRRVTLMRAMVAYQSQP